MAARHKTIDRPEINELSADTCFKKLITLYQYVFNSNSQFNRLKFINLSASIYGGCSTQTCLARTVKHAAASYLSTEQSKHGDKRDVYKRQCAHTPNPIFKPNIRCSVTAMSCTPHFHTNYSHNALTSKR